MPEFFTYHRVDSIVLHHAFLGKRENQNLLSSPESLRRWTLAAVLQVHSMTIYDFLSKILFRIFRNSFA